MLCILTSKWLENHKNMTTSWWMSMNVTLFIPTSHGTGTELIYSMELDCRLPYMIVLCFTILTNLTWCECHFQMDLIEFEEKQGKSYIFDIIIDSMTTTYHSTKIYQCLHFTISLQIKAAMLLKTQMLIYSIDSNHITIKCISMQSHLETWVSMTILTAVVFFKYLRILYITTFSIKWL